MFIINSDTLRLRNRWQDFQGPRGEGIWRLSPCHHLPSGSGKWKVAESGSRTSHQKSAEATQHPASPLAFSCVRSSTTLCFCFSPAQVLTLASGSCLLCCRPAYELRPHFNWGFAMLPSSEIRHLKVSLEYKLQSFISLSFKGQRAGKEDLELCFQMTDW